MAITSLYEKSKQQNISFFAAIKQSLEDGSLKGKAKDSLKFLVDKLEEYNAKIGQTNLSDVAKNLLTEVGYIAMWKAENTLEAQGRLENIEEFISSLGDFSNVTEFLEYVSLVEARDDKNLSDAVTVMTVHAAKGLEFDLVFVPGLEDGLFPSGKSIEERNGLEEERRLMYVAITRAKKQLILSYAKNRYVFGDMQVQMPSRFIKELPHDEVEEENVSFGGEFLYSNRFNSGFSSVKNAFSPPKTSHKIDEGMVGKRVFHQKFGYGKVSNEDGNKLEIVFDKTGVKTVIKDFIVIT